MNTVETRPRVALLSGSFFAGALLSGTAMIALLIFGFKSFDPKFRDDVLGAFILSLFAVLLLSVIGSVVVAVTAFLLRQRLFTKLIAPFFGGLIYSALFLLIDSLLKARLGAASEVVPIVEWPYIAIAPVLIIGALTLLRRK